MKCQEPEAQYLVDLITNLGYEPPYIGETNAQAYLKIIRCIESLAIKAKLIKPEEVHLKDTHESLRDPSLGQIN
jgi:hypothetical protein